MPAYVIANVTVKDPVRYEDYRRLVTPTIEPFGGGAPHFGHALALVLTSVPQSLHFLSPMIRSPLRQRDRAPELRLKFVLPASPPQ